MSRPRISPEAAAQEAFLKEVRVRRAELDMTQRELGDAVGVVPSVMSKLLSEPDKLSAGRLRKMVHTLGINPMVMMAFLGYSAKDIQKLKGGHVYDPENQGGNQ